MYLEYVQLIVTILVSLVSLLTEYLTTTRSSFQLTIYSDESHEVRYSLRNIGTKTEFIDNVWLEGPDRSKYSLKSFFKIHNTVKLRPGDSISSLLSYTPSKLPYSELNEESGHKLKSVAQMMLKTSEGTVRTAIKMDEYQSSKYVIEDTYQFENISPLRKKYENLVIILILSIEVILTWVFHEEFFTGILILLIIVQLITSRIKFVYTTRISNLHLGMAYSLITTSILSKYLPDSQWAYTISMISSLLGALVLLGIAYVNLKENYYHWTNTKAHTYESYLSDFNNDN